MDKIALVVDPYAFEPFEVRRIDQFGNQHMVARSQDLAECLRGAANRLGYAIVLPISGPNTSL